MPGQIGCDLRRPGARCQHRTRYASPPTFPGGMPRAAGRVADARRPDVHHYRGTTVGSWPRRADLFDPRRATTAPDVYLRLLVRCLSASCLDNLARHREAMGKSQYAEIVDTLVDDLAGSRPGA